MYANIVGVVEVVAEIEFREPERDDKLGVLRGECRCADECESEVRPASCVSLSRDGCSMSTHRKSCFLPTMKGAVIVSATAAAILALSRAEV